MKHLLRSQFVRDASMTAGAQFILALSSMVTGVLIARVLGPAGKGELSVLIALGSATVLLMSFGVQASTIYFLGRFRHARSAVLSNNLLFGTVGGLTAGITLVLAGILFQDALLGDIHLTLLQIYGVFVTLNYFNEFARRAVLAEGRISMYNIPDLLSAVLWPIGTVAIFLIVGKAVRPLIMLRVASEALVLIVLARYIRRSIVTKFAPSLTLLTRQIAYGIKNYASSLLWLVMLQSDLILCNHFLGPSSTGIYSVAVSLGLPITLLANVLGLLIFQRVSGDSVRSRRVANTNLVLRLLIVLALGVAIAIAAMTWWLVPLIYGPRFYAASYALVILLPGLVLLSVSTVTINFLAGEGSPPVVYRAPALGVLVNVVANVFVIPRLGINGAAATSTVCYAIVCGLVLRYYLRSTQVGVGAVLLAKSTDLHWLRPSRLGGRA